jgi:hypothetical protein
MDELFKSFDNFKQSQEEQKLSYIKEISNKSISNIKNNLIDENTNDNNKNNDTSIIFDINQLVDDSNYDKDNTNSINELDHIKNSFFDDYQEIDYKKNKKNKDRKDKDEFIKNIIIEEENKMQNSQFILDTLYDEKSNMNLEELNPKDDYYYDKKAKRKYHRNLKKNYGNFIYDNNIYQLRNFNHLDKRPTIDIYNEEYSESDGYDENYSISREQFNEKKKHLKENKIFYNVLSEYIENHKELFTMSILEQVSTSDNLNNEKCEVDNDDNDKDNEKKIVIDGELEHEEADTFEDIDSEVIDKLIEFEYQKCLGILDLVLQYSDSKDITYDKEFLINKLKGYMVVMKPYCLNHHNFIGYLKIKDGELKLVTGTFIKYLENNRLLMTKDFKYMFSMNPVRLLFKKIRIEDITEWIYGVDS